MCRGYTENKEKTRKPWERGALIFGVILFLCVFWIHIGTTANAAQPLHMEANFGLEGYIRYGRGLPLRVELESMEQDFTGTVEVVVPNSDQNYWDSGSSWALIPSMKNGSDYKYAQEVSLAAGESQTLWFYLGSAVDRIYMQVQVLSESGQVLMQEEKIFDFDMMNQRIQVLVGLLDDTLDELTAQTFSEPHLMQTDDGNSYEITLLPLESDSLPRSFQALELLDILYADSSTLERLEKDQLIAIESWIHNGGRIFLQDQDGVDYFGGIAAADMEQLEVAGSNAQVRVCDFGEGHFYLWKQSFTELFTEAAEVVQERLISSVLTTVLGETYLEQLVEESYGMYGYGFSSDDYLNFVYMDKQPNVVLYGVVFALYLAFCGPLLYFFLKKIRKREWMWRILIGLAAGFTVLVFVLGSSTRLKAPYLKYLTVESFQGRTKTESIHFSVSAPFNNTYRLYLDNSYTIIPQQREVGYYSSDKQDYSQYNVGITEKEEEVEVEIQGRSAFSRESFEAQKIIDLENGIGIEAEVSMFDKQVSGTIKNNLGYDLEHAVIAMYHFVIALGDFKDGETLDLSDFTAKSFDDGVVYSIGEKIMGVDMRKMSAGPEYYMANHDAEALNHIILETFATFTENACLIGIKSERNVLPLQLDSGYEAYGNTVVSVPLEVDMTRGEEVYRPYISQTAVTEDPNSWYFYVGDNSMYNDQCVITYELGEDLTEYTLYFEEEDYEETDYLRGKCKEAYFLNQETGGYDLRNVDHAAYTRDELAAYLHDDNKITIKYVAPRSTEELQEGFAKIPRLRVIGRL